MGKSMTFRIFYLDDQPDIREIVAASLALDPDVEVETFATGAGLLARLETSRPDLFVLDIMMPGLDGPAVLGRIRANPATAAIPVIFATAKVLPPDYGPYKELGAAGILSKPFDPLTLAKQLRAMVGIA
jgi:CheY-like chemotaxis protein